MDGATSGSVQKQERTPPNNKTDAPKATKTLNRVPRACNACRKQKMRCEGAENPPCRRCRTAGLECLFEKPSREATLTGEAGLERIRSLEAHVADIRLSQVNIQHTLLEIVGHLRGARSPSVYSTQFQPSPSMHSMASPTTTPPVQQQMIEIQQQQVPPYVPGRPIGQQYGTFNNSQTLPPFSSIQSHTSSVRNQPNDSSQNRRQQSAQIASGSKRQAPGIPSGESSDLDDDSGELPAYGLVAPWEVLRGLADVAIERAEKENGDSEPHSRARSGSPDRGSRPNKRRKTRHKPPRALTFPDVVTKNIISEEEARELFRIFYHGCSTFLPVFDSKVDTYDALHLRSPFAVNCICMVAARVRDGGGPSSVTYIRCLEEVQAISCATLFSPVTRNEAVQSMILVSGWSDNGWLSGGHAVRMAMELSMHKAWPTLMKRMDQEHDFNEDRDLVTACRTWFCLYLFEHQLSYGTGRPAILKDDDSIAGCRRFLDHPFSIEDDMRLISTVELMTIREHINNKLHPFERPVDDLTFKILHEADVSFRSWFQAWDQAFSQKYEDAAFYRQSLHLQNLHAELFHNATALRGINGPKDVQNMPSAQRQLAIRSIDIASQGLEVTINSPAYREGMKYAVHYTHATATFAASFLLRLARLFPADCDLQKITQQVEKLAQLMSEIPGTRYALTLQLMLKRARKRKPSVAVSPALNQQIPPPRPGIMQAERPLLQQHPSQQTFNSPFDHHNVGPGPGVHHPQPVQQEQPMSAIPHFMNTGLRDTEAERIWQGLAESTEQVPVWLSDQSLGGQSFSRHGMDAFLLPWDYLPPAPQIR